jgi:hypothetical protein
VGWFQKWFDEVGRQPASCGSAAMLQPAFLFNSIGGAALPSSGDHHVIRFKRQKKAANWQLVIGRRQPEWLHFSINRDFLSR